MKPSADEMAKMRRVAADPRLLRLAQEFAPSQAEKRALRQELPGTTIALDVRLLAKYRRDDETGFTQLVAEVHTATAAVQSPLTAKHDRSKAMQSATMAAVPLQQLNDLVARFKLAINRGLHDLALEVMDEMVQQGWRMTFDSDVQGEVMFNTLLDVPQPRYYSSADADIVERTRLHEERVVLSLESNDQTSCLCVDIEGMAQSFCWLQEDMCTFLNWVFEKVTHEEPAPRSYQEKLAIARICRRHLEPTSFMAREVETWLLRVWLAENNPYSIRRHGLSEEMPASKHVFKELYEVVDLFLRLGWTMAMVRDEFTKHIRRMIKERVCINCLLPLLAAKCFTDEERKRGFLHELVSGEYHDYVWRGLARGDGGEVEYYQLLFDLCFRQYQRNPGANETFYRPRLVQLLSEGKVGRTIQLLHIMGNDICSWLPGFSGYDLAFKTEQRLQELLPEALSMAYEQQRYGVAAALVQHFSRETFLAHELPASGAPVPIEVRTQRLEIVKTVTALAMELEQPICFQELTFSYYIKPGRD